jgi:hypothetical protein
VPVGSYGRSLHLRSASAPCEPESGQWRLARLIQRHLVLHAVTRRVERDTGRRRFRGDPRRNAGAREDERARGRGDQEQQSGDEQPRGEVEERVDPVLGRLGGLVGNAAECRGQQGSNPTGAECRAPRTHLRDEPLERWQRKKCEQARRDPEAAERYEPRIEATPPLAAAFEIHAPDDACRD